MTGLGFTPNYNCGINGNICELDELFSQVDSEYRKRNRQFIAICTPGFEKLSIALMPNLKFEF